MRAACTMQSSVSKVRLLRGKSDDLRSSYFSSTSQLRRDLTPVIFTNL